MAVFAMRPQLVVVDLHNSMKSSRYVVWVKRRMKKQWRVSDIRTFCCVHDVPSASCPRLAEIGNLPGSRNK